MCHRSPPELSCLRSTSTDGPPFLRVEDLGDGGKKASSRSWKNFTVILTGSQLLFFKDPAWATVFQKQTEEHAAHASRRGSEGSRITLPKMSAFKPDEVLSVKDAIAITETSYSKVSLLARSPPSAPTGLLTCSLACSTPTRSAL